MKAMHHTRSTGGLVWSLSAPVCRLLCHRWHYGHQLPFLVRVAHRLSRGHSLVQRDQPPLLGYRPAQDVGRRRRHHLYHRSEFGYRPAQDDDRRHRHPYLYNRSECAQVCHLLCRRWREGHQLPL
ncbi:unnamed protein product [Ectocarpus sp. CCAP 1310/34]|nr:unnamed protein product [Ectocarpus sp. CCAP 1310/34]